MKKYTKVFSLMLALCMVISMSIFAEGTIDSITPETGVTVTETNGGNELAGKDKFKLTYDGEVANAMYLLLVLDNEGYEEDGVPTAGNIKYVNQATADANGDVVFDSVYPKDITNSKVYLAGGDFTIGLKSVAAIVKQGPAGFDVSGSVKSYNPNNKVTVELKQGSTVVKTTTIAAEAGNGQVTQGFVIKEVATGTYDLVVAKDAHLTYTITGLKVNDAAVELSSVITMLVGDINADGLINVNDLNVVWNAANYNKAKAEAANGLTDLNGDDLVNVNDLNIVWNAANYNKGSEDCTVSY